MRNVSLDIFFQYVKNSACQKDAKKVKIYMGGGGIGGSIFHNTSILYGKIYISCFTQLNFSV